MVFIKYCAQSKDYVMYEEHPNGGMIGIDFRNVDFFKDEFPTIGEIKKDVELFELQQDIQPSFSEAGNLNSNQVTEGDMPPLFKRNGGDLSAKENEIRPQHPIHKQSQPVNKVYPQSPVSEHAGSPYVQDPTPHRDSGSDSPHAQGSTPLRERGTNASPR